MHGALTFVGVVSIPGQLYRKNKSHLTIRFLIFIFPFPCRAVRKLRVAPQLLLFSFTLKLNPPYLCSTVRSLFVMCFVSMHVPD